jgi:hypothetical protein
MTTLSFEDLTDQEKGALTEALFAFAHLTQAFFAASAEPGPRGVRQTVTFDSADEAGRFTEFLGSRLDGLRARA